MRNIDFGIWPKSITGGQFAPSIVFQWSRCKALRAVREGHNHYFSIINDVNKSEI